jgi:hypothetical protein
MKTRYYLSLFPVEALIASQLDPEQFSYYMAYGSKKGTLENLIFAEVEGGFGQSFDWGYAEKKCVPHSDGRPKNSLYMSVYRALELMPADKIGNIYLVAGDGRSLKLSRGSWHDTPSASGYRVYQELCPLRPLVVSALEPAAFAAYLTDPAHKTAVPKILFADVKTIDVNETATGNIGRAYGHNQEHLAECAAAVTSGREKKNKIVSRSHVDRFTYQVIKSGIFLGDGKELLYYPMPDAETLRKENYDWGRSAMIL